MPNAFELFGFDFLLDKDMQPYLLEVNEGPALEGHCRPEVCRAIVEDTLSIVLDPLLAEAAADAGGVTSSSATASSSSSSSSGGREDPFHEAEEGRGQGRRGGAYSLLRDFAKGMGGTEQRSCTIYSTELVQRVRALMAVEGERDDEE